MPPLPNSLGDSLFWGMDALVHSMYWPALVDQFISSMAGSLRPGTSIDLGFFQKSRQSGDNLRLLQPKIIALRKISFQIEQLTLRFARLDGNVPRRAESVRTAGRRQPPPSLTDGEGAVDRMVDC